MERQEFVNKLKQTLIEKGEAIICYNDIHAELRLELKGDEVRETYGHGRWKEVYYRGKINDIQFMINDFYWNDITIK